MRLHHVQVSMPAGEEALARRFYRDALGLVEVEKPPSLVARGGCWFRSYAGDGQTVQAEVHLGAEVPFTAAAKAHPAFLVSTVSELEELATAVASAGFAVSWTERETLEGYERFHCRDGFGNRVEVLTPAP